MAIRQPPSSIKDPNLRGFLQELRNAIGGVSSQVTQLLKVQQSTSGGGGGGGGTDPGNGGGGGGTDPGNGGGGGGVTPPALATIVLTIEPTKPLSEENFTLTATVTGDQPTGTVQFRQDGNLMTLDPVALSAGKASVTDQREKGVYTFVAEYSGDLRNLSAVSNTITVEIGSMWDGPPAALTSLTAESGINFITLKWTLPYTGDLDVIEIWMATTSTLTLDAEGEPTNATKIGESNGSLLVYVPPEMGTTYYFWGRVRDAELLYSDFYPALNAGVPGAAVSLEDEIANSPLWEDLGTRLTDGEAAIEEISGIVEGPNGLVAQYMVKTDVNGLVSGFGLYNDGEVSDFFIRADRFAVGNPASYRGGTCSIAGHTTAEACTAAGGTWTWTDANTTNIPFIVYTTQQTINAPDGSGKTLTIQPGVYMKTANIQKAFIGDAEIYGDLKSYSWAASGGPTTFPFNGWKLDKASNLALYGGSFALYDEYGNPVIQAGKIEFNQFKRLIVSASSELFTIPKPPNTAITPSTITLNAVLQNISGTVTWSVTSGTYGTALGTGVQKIIDPAQMTTATATFKASTTVGGVVYEDYVTLAKVQDGSDSLWLYLSNEAHLVPADVNGNVTSYAGASTVAKVYRGAIEETGWTVSAASYTGLSGAPDVVGQTVGFADGSPSMTADIATITVRAAKSGQTLDRIFSVTKAKQGAVGPQGPQGAAGAQGNSLYTWIAYANNSTGTVGFTTGAWSGQTYIGIANNKTSPTESSVSTDYTWSLMKGDQGIPGSPGANGQTTYTWFAYANGPNGTPDFTTGNWTNQTYMGIAANKTTATESTNPADYTWSKIQGPTGPTGPQGNQGVQGPAGANGQTTYFHVAYANDANGGGFNQVSGSYIGTYVDTNPTDSSNAALYTWVKIEGAQGPTGNQGIPGVNGANGQTSYLHIKYSDNGTSFTANSGETPGKWIGQYVDFVATDSNTFSAYTWSKIEGPTGPTGPTGPAGTRGSVNAYITTFSAAAAWDAIVATAGVGTVPVPGDWVWTQAGQRHAYTTGGYPGTWTSGQSTQFSGAVIVDGTLTANKLYAGSIGSYLIELGAYDNDPNAIIQSNGFISGSNGWRIRGNGDAEFNTVIVRSGANVGNNALSWSKYFSRVYNWVDSTPTLRNYWDGRPSGQLAPTNKTPRLNANESFWITFWTPEVTIPRATGRTSVLVCTLSCEVPSVSRGSTGIGTGATDGVWLVLCGYNTTTHAPAELYQTELFFADGRDIHSRYFCNQAAFIFPNAALPTIADEFTTVNTNSDRVVYAYGSPLSSWYGLHLRAYLRHSGGGGNTYNNIRLNVHAYVE